MRKVTVGYVHSDSLIRHANRFPKVSLRAGAVHSLIEAYGLLDFLVPIEPHKATSEELKRFHTADYVTYLQRKSSEDDDDNSCDNVADDYGLTYDCCPFRGAYDCAAWCAGASLDGAAFLTKGLGQVAINWCGGWHHSGRDQASGYCYINDIVLAILKLRETFDRVLYVDLDLHHGDGVQDAFASSNKVMTVSLHKYASGFFPGSGAVTDIGIGKGKYFTVNVPLKNGVDDKCLVAVFCKIMVAVKQTFDPNAVVCQCGADGLVGDPMASFNLTPHCLVQCVEKLLEWNIPLLLLGGGGYNCANVARCWTYLTACTLGVNLDSDIPEHEHFSLYGPYYELSVESNNRPNENSPAELDDIVRKISSNLATINL